MQNNIERITAAHKKFDVKISTHPKVLGTRQCGVIYALDLKLKMERYGNLRDKLFDHFMAQGVFLRPLGNTIYILAPYITSDEQLQKIYSAIEGALVIV